MRLNQPDSRRSILQHVGSAFGTVGKIVAPVLLLALIAGGVFYVRLMKGPVSVSFLAPSIESAINAELDGLRVDVPAVMMSLVGGRLEFQLKNVKLFDRTNAPVATAPLAAVKLSHRALYRARIAPSRIILIKPRLLLHYSAENGVSLSFPGVRADTGGTSRAGPDAGGDGKLTSLQRGVARHGTHRLERGAASNPQARLDLARTIAVVAKRARGKDDTTSFFEAIGLRDAVVVLDYAGSQSVWRVPEASFDLVHFDQRSVVSGLVTVASSKGVWHLALRAEESEKSQTVNFKASVRDVRLDSIADAVPGLAALQIINFPVSTAATLSLASDGSVLSGNITLAFRKAVLKLPGLGNAPPRIDEGRFTLTYRRGRRELVLQPSRLVWSNSTISFGGRIMPAVEGADESGWTYDLTALRGKLSPQTSWGRLRALKDWTARGRVDLSAGTVILDQAVARAGDATALMSGRFFVGDRIGYQLSGAFGVMPARDLLLFWPEFLTPPARAYYAEAVREGQLEKTRFSANWSAPNAGGGTASSSDRLPDPTTGVKSQTSSGAPEEGTLASAPGTVQTDGNPSSYSANFDLNFTDLTLASRKDLPPVIAPKARFLLEDDRYEFTVPKGTFLDGASQRLTLSDLNFTARKIYAPSSEGLLKARLTGTVADAMVLMAMRPMGASPPPKALMGRIGGRIDARLDGTIPLTWPADTQRPEPVMTGQLRLLDGSAKKLVGGLDVSGATVLVDFGAELVNASGKLLIGGVGATLNWQHILGAPPDKQPPARLKATIDAADRAALGLAVNHILQGDVGVEIEWVPGTENDKPIRVRANLTETDVTVDSLAWRKPAGEKASLDLDLVMKAGHVARLGNIRMSGQGIAIEGAATLNPKGDLTAFDLPLFSINTVTRLKVRGLRKKNNVWRVSVRGQTFEGRDLFRALFSAGRLKPADDSPHFADPGLELDAKIDNVIGFWNASLREVSVELSKRNGRIQGLLAHGTLKSGKKLIVRVDPAQNRKRRLIAVSDDAGGAFELVGFYGNAREGKLQLAVNLDGDGRAEKTGELQVRSFSVLGDPVISEVVSAPKEKVRRGRRRDQYVARDVINFSRMYVRFSVGHGQFVMQEAQLRGPLVGAGLHGKVDFEARRINVGGTYFPLQGLNAALGVIPGIGQIIAGPRGEGVLGVNFAVRGKLENPEILVHPLSPIAPGIFRDLFPATTSTPRTVTPRRPSGQNNGWQPRGSDTRKGWRQRMLQPDLN